MAFTRTDEILDKAIEMDASVIPRWDIVNPDGSTVAENVQMALKNPVTQKGTRFTASLLNEILAASGQTDGTASAFTLAQDKFALFDGAKIMVRWHTPPTENATLNVNSTGAKLINLNGNTNSLCELFYDSELDLWVASGGGGVSSIAQFTSTFSNNVLTLLGTDSGQDLICFQTPATYNYASTHTIKIGEITYNAKLVNGDSLHDGVFGNGAIVLATRGGTNLFFNLSGSAELNFDVAVAANAASLPAAASKNRMHIISDIPLPTSGAKFEIGATLPAAPQPTGKVFIQTGQSTTYAFNALKGNNILYTYPTAAYQWDGVTWQPRDAYIDRTTTWEQFSFGRIYLYKNGDNIAGFVAGAYNSATGSLTVSFNPTLRATYTGSSSGVTSYFTAPFNVTGKNTLSVNVAANTRQTGNGMHFLGLVTTATQNPVSGNQIFTRYIAIPSLQTGQFNINLSDLSGNYYVYYGQWRSSDATVYQFNVEADEIWAV